MYGDMGKAARDVFGKGFHFGVMKLEVKTKTSSGVEFTTGANSNTENGKVAANLETKYKCPQYGLTFTEKWNTDNNLNTVVDVQDQIVKGLKLSLDSTFSPQTGANAGKVKAELKQDAFAANCDMNLDMAGPLVNASLALGHNGWLAGYQMAFDSAKSKLTKNNFALGYTAKDFQVHLNVNDGQVFGGSIYQKINPELETGVNVGWTSASNATNFGVGCKYILDKEASVRAKVNNFSQIGLGYQQKLRPGVNLTLSTLIDGKNFNQGGHKVGLALELEA